MSENLRTTILVVMIAAAMTVAAIYYYPWQAPVGAKSVENQNLIEEYETDKVRKIEIKEVGDDNRLKQMTLVLKGRQWTIPSRFDFPAENVGRIQQVSECLKNLLVHELKSEEKRDHQDSGVLDPDESAGRSVGIGTKLVLYDRADRVLGSLIIGKKEGGEDRPKPGEKEKYAVRIPGQPGIFLVDFDRQLLSTSFRDWIKPNLIEFGTSEKWPLLLLIRNHIIAPEKLTDEVDGNETPELKYVARFLVPFQQNMAWRADRIDVPQDGKVVSLISKRPPFSAQSASMAASGIIQLPIINVAEKPQKLTAKFEKINDQSLKPGDLKPLAPAGFLVSKQNQIQGVRGEVTATIRSGVDIHFVLGKVVGGQTSQDIHRYMISYATINRELFVEPKPLSESDQQDEAKTLEYKKALAEYNDRLQVAVNAVNSFNETMAPWVFRIDEGVTKALIPDLEMLFDLSKIKMNSADPDKDKNVPGQVAKGDSAEDRNQPGNKEDSGKNEDKKAKNDNEKDDDKAKKEEKQDDQAWP